MTTTTTHLLHPTRIGREGYIECTGQKWGESPIEWRTSIDPERVTCTDCRREDIITCGGCYEEVSRCACDEIEDEIYDEHFERADRADRVAMGIDRYSMSQIAGS